MGRLEQDRTLTRRSFLRVGGLTVGAVALVPFAVVQRSLAQHREPLRTSLSVGSTGHVADHQEIARLLNKLVDRLS